MHGLVIHGGAFMMARDYTRQNDCLRGILEEAHTALAGGQSALDCVTRAVCAMEDSGLFHAGKGTGRNSAGYHELDASIMDGATGMAGAAASLRTIRNPVLGARAVMEKTPHVFLVADGAENFLKKQGLETVDPERYFAIDDGPREQVAHGTVGAVALDLRGNLAAATSTAGTPDPSGRYRLLLQLADALGDGDAGQSTGAADPRMTLLPGAAMPGNRWIGPWRPCWRKKSAPEAGGAASSPSPKTGRSKPAMPAPGCIAATSCRTGMSGLAGFRSNGLYCAMMAEGFHRWV
ncbi:MAG: isoaspartyl peptidase/L-asparaginase [Micavibrio aeruginosavorus]|nr:isoaspartyl peptidase/L-asparaginase [Micavibrio aeruginosavorus]